MHICEVKRDGHKMIYADKKSPEWAQEKWKDGNFIIIFTQQGDSHEERRHAGGRRGGYTNINYFSHSLSVVLLYMFADECGRRRTKKLIILCECLVICP